MEILIIRGGEVALVISSGVMIWVQCRGVVDQHLESWASVAPRNREGLDLKLPPRGADKLRADHEDPILLDSRGVKNPSFCGSAVSQVFHSRSVVSPRRRRLGR